MDIAELHDEENLHTQMEDRWENYGSLDGIIDSDDPFTLQGAPRFELSEKIDSLLSHALTDDENLLLRQVLGMGCKQRSVKELAKIHGQAEKKHPEANCRYRREAAPPRRFYSTLEVFE